MNIISNEILMLSKVIKVKDKVDKILKRYSIIPILKEYTQRYIKDRDENAFLSINRHPMILKSPFLFYKKNNTQMMEFFISNAQAISSEKTARGLVSRDKRVKIGKYYKIKKIVLYVNMKVSKDDTIKRIDNIIPIIQHEWVHVEQLIRSKKLKDEDEGMDIFKGDDGKSANKHQRALLAVQDVPFLNRLLKENIDVLKKQINNGTLLKEDLMNFSNSANIKDALTMAAVNTMTMQVYHSRKSEISAYAVEASEMFVREETDLLMEILISYIMIGIKSPKIKKKFLRLYSEALQERGVSNKMISEHVNKVYSKVKVIILSNKKQAEEFMKSIGDN
jgi:hypothetical protein